MTGLRHGYGDDAPACVNNPIAFAWPSRRTLHGSRHVDPDKAREFFAVAVRTCGNCPHKAPAGRCADDALTANPEFSGVAGGLIFHEGRVL